jgi:CelD/BcsL family acetyltransferase involved in cellulose biosynthesis
MGLLSRSAAVDSSSSFAVASTIDEVESLRPEWEALQPSSPTSDLDVFLTYLRHAPGVVRPHVVRVEQDGQPALLVARVEDQRLPARLGYATVLNPLVRTITVAYGGVLGRADAETAPALVDSLWRSVSRKEADLVRIRLLEQGSALHTAATEGAPRLLYDRFAEPLPHWRAALPSSFDEFIARRAKKVRWQARRDATRLQEVYGDGLAVRPFRTSDGLDRLFEDSAAVHSTTYQSALGVGFSTSELQRRLTKLAMDRGRFRGYLLYLRGKPVAFCHGTLHRNTFWLETTGFNPAYADYRPGGFLLMRLIGDLCAEGTADTFDFGFGDATYKRQLGDEVRLEQDVSVWALRPKTIDLSLTRAMLGWTTRCAKRLLRGQRIAKARRLWRMRATPGGS